MLGTKKDLAVRLQSLHRDRRRAIDGRKVQIRELRSQHKIILMEDLRGASNKEIALKTGMTPEMVSLVKNSDVYRLEKAKLDKRVEELVVEQVVDPRKKIEELARVSLVELEAMLRDRKEDSKVRADIAFDVLDRAGFAAVKKHLHGHVDADAALRSAYEQRKRRIAAQAAIEDSSPESGNGEETEDEEAEVASD